MPEFAGSMSSASTSRCSATSADSARHTDWEEEMLRLGRGWRLDPAPAADEVIT